jgi:hypothetical protein
LTATALNSVKVKLDWTDTSSDEDGFEIQVQDINGNYVQVTTVGSDIETYTATNNIEPETNYTFRVRAYRGSYTSTWSTDSVTTPAWSAGDSDCN